MNGKKQIKSLVALAALVSTASVLNAGQSFAQTATTTLFAVVKPEAVIARGNGAVSVGKNFGLTGEYFVVFNRNVSNCAYSATIGRDRPGGTPPGIIIVSPKSGNVNAVNVVTRDKNGVQFDSGFHLVVVCN